MAREGHKFASSSEDEDDEASAGKSVALGCLVHEIDGNQQPRKALADECGKKEQQFSKMLAGAFRLVDFDKLPREIQVGWMKRYGREVLGVTVREIEPAELNEELLALVDRLVNNRRLSARVGRPVQAKKDLDRKVSRAVNE